jgi:hypothetical protein
MTRDDDPGVTALQRMIGLVLVFVVLLAAALTWQRWYRANKPPPVFAGEHYPTAHYDVHSNAGPAPAKTAGARTEALRTAYLAFFELPEPAAATPRLQLRLYATRREFKRFNAGPPWAESFYSAPVAHAYHDPKAANPAHWLLRAATQQLGREVAAFPTATWADEGIALYFATSVVRDGALRPGELDPETYPLWFVGGLALAGDARKDFEALRLVPLRALVSGEGGPPVEKAVNAWAIGHWSLAHFLVHHDDGRHAAAFRELVRTGGGLAQFETLVGPVEEIEPQWYAYLQAQVVALGGCANTACTAPADVIVVE